MAGATIRPRPLPRLKAGPPQVALTFDDGPWPYYTEQVLGVLRKYGIHATFFVMGRNAAAHPELVRQEAAAGHEVENHTWNHPYLARLGTDLALQEIAGTAAEVLFLTGRAPRYLRPPYGSVDQAIRLQAASVGEETLLWNVDPRDWALPGTWAIEQNVLAHIQDRAIVLMHDGGGDRSETVAALDALIPRLQALGYRFVTVQQMMDPLAPGFPALRAFRTDGSPARPR